MGMNFKDGHAEVLYMQHKLSSLNTPKIFFFKDNKVPNPNVKVKHLARIHRDMDHADHAQIHQVYQVRMQDEQIYGTQNIQGNTGMDNL